MAICISVGRLAFPKPHANTVAPLPLTSVAASMAVYGEENFRRLYGDVMAIPSDRIAAAADELRQLLLQAGHGLPFRVEFELHRLTLTLRSTARILQLPATCRLFVFRSLLRRLPPPRRCGNACLQVNEDTKEFLGALDGSIGDVVSRVSLLLPDSTTTPVEAAVYCLTFVLALASALVLGRELIEQQRQEGLTRDFSVICACEQVAANAGVHRTPSQFGRPQWLQLHLERCPGGSAP